MKRTMIDIILPVRADACPRNRVGPTYPVMSLILCLGGAVGPIQGRSTRYRSAPNLEAVGQWKDNTRFSRTQACSTKADRS